MTNPTDNTIARIADELREHGTDLTIEYARAVPKRLLIDAANALSTAQQVEELREALTPSEETKAAYIGEFSFAFEDTDDEWGLPITRRIDVPWTTIKEIMAAIKARAALKHHTVGVGL